MTSSFCLFLVLLLWCLIVISGATLVMPDCGSVYFSLALGEKSGPGQAKTVADRLCWPFFECLLVAYLTCAKSCSS